MSAARRTTARTAAAAALALAAVAVATPTATSAPGSGAAATSRGSGLTAVGLTDGGQRLVVFDTRRPDRVTSLGRIRGLRGDTALVGIDYRPANGKLYGVGDEGGVYTLSRFAFAYKASQLSATLDGTSFGVDFNPAADRLRIVSDTGQNLRHDVTLATGGTATDGTLTYPATPTAPATTALGVTGSGYTNNDADPMTATTLYDIDTRLDQVVVQSPANSGLLAPTGKLGVDAGPAAGFDVYSVLRGGTTVRARPFATLSVGGAHRLYEIDLLTGRATSRGAFPADRQVSDLAFPLDQR